MVSNVGSDPTTVGGLLKAFSKGKAGASLMDGLISDGYLPPLDDAADSWVELFKKVHDTYIPKLPLDGNVSYGMALAYTFAKALQQAGQNPTRQGIVDAVEKGGLKGPTLVPYRYSADSHAGATGVQIAKIADGKIELKGDPLTTDDEAGAIEPYTRAIPTRRRTASRRRSDAAVAFRTLTTRGAAGRVQRDRDSSARRRQYARTPLVCRNHPARPAGARPGGAGPPAGGAARRLGPRQPAPSGVRLAGDL